MASNILKKQLDCISEDFLGEVFGRVGKPMWRALTHMFGAVTTGKSTLVTDIARTLRADSSRSEAKLRFISGRPPKARPKDPMQMLLAL